jgi:hypothetical protein
VALQDADPRGLQREIQRLSLVGAHALACSIVLRPQIVLGDVLIPVSPESMTTNNA